MRITIEIEDSDDKNGLTIQPGSYYWDKQQKKSNGWVDGIDQCKNCPNNPLNPNSQNYSGFCMCAIPSLYGPNRVIC